MPRQTGHSIYAHSRPDKSGLRGILSLYLSYTDCLNIDKIKPLKILCPVCILFFILLFPFSAHALDVPKLQGHVNDYANMISPSTKAELEKELNSFEQTDSTQIVILTIPSLEGKVLDEFSIKVAESWKIGQKGKDNGIIITVAKQEKKIRVEVGRGLEGKLTDLAAGRIVDLVIKPKFKRGDFDGGFVSGVHSLIDATRGEFKADKNHLPKKKDSIHNFLTILIFGVIVLLFIGSISRIVGGVSGAIGLPALIHLTLTPIGLIAFIILSAAGLLAGLFLPKLFSSGRHHSGGGFLSGGGYYGSGSGFSGGGFGGFSGGGGSFGGGGASGDW